MDRDWSHYDTTRVVFKPARMTAAELEAGLAYAYERFYRPDAILSRAFRPGPGVLQRLALNLAYKRIEPAWKLLDAGLPAAWARTMTHWYMRPPHAGRPAVRAALPRPAETR